MEKGFKPEAIRDLKAQLKDLGSAYPNYVKIIYELSNTIDTYQKDNVTAFPDIMKNLDSYIDCLAKVETKDAQLVSGAAKNCCRECMFHLDDCFVNSIFLVFKSLELGEHLKPTKTRPTLRFESLQKAIQKLQNR